MTLETALKAKVVGKSVAAYSDPTYGSVLKNTVVDPTKKHIEVDGATLIKLMTTY